MVLPAPGRGAVLVLLALVAGASAVRDQLFRQLQQDQQASDSCNNTVAGRWYIADNKGMVCPRENMDHNTGCCTSGELHSCNTCSMEDKCCSQYEFCVSCCLKPENKPEAHKDSIYRGRNKPETGHWPTTFEYCAAACRTTARSTQHENAFILDRKHCFSKLGRPHVAIPPAPPLPPNITLLPGGASQSCDATCSLKHMACRAEYFHSINNCNALRSKFMCEAGCGPSAPDQKEFPGYVEGIAPKTMRPAFCGFLPAYPGQAAPEFNCSHGGGAVRRLCPCEPLPEEVKAEGGSTQGGGAANNGTAAGTSGTAAAGAAAGDRDQRHPGGGGGGGAHSDQRFPGGGAGDSTAAAQQEKQQQQAVAAAGGEQQHTAEQAAGQQQQEQQPQHQEQQQEGPALQVGQHGQSQQQEQPVQQ